MGSLRTSLSFPAPGLAAVALAATAFAQELPPLPPVAPTPPPARVAPPVTGTVHRKAAPAVDAPATDDDPASARADAVARLATLPGDDAKDASATTRALREALQERLRRLDAWDRAVADRRASEDPRTNLESAAAEAKADLERVKACLDQSAREPDALLPATFRNAPASPPESTRTAMKEAIDAAQAEVKTWAAKVDQLRAEPPAGASGAAADARTRRDKSQQQLSSLRLRNAGLEAAVREAQTPEARDVAREKLVNGRWEARVEAERLRAEEAALDLADRRADAAALKARLAEAHSLLAQKTLDRMKERYRAMAARQENDLHRKAVTEQTRSETSADPLERYRARRASEMLELEARVVRCEDALATNPSPSYEEQRALADRAESEFAGTRALLEDGKVSRLDALHLNNDFRRLARDRSRVVGHDLATVNDRLSRLEAALGEVELQLINDARDDRSELDSLLARLPRPLHARATQMFEAFEKRHLDLMNRRHDALDKLARRTELTHAQILRRLRTLDEHFGFVRTHMFWLRDEEPLGAATLSRVEREAGQLGRAASRIGSEALDRPSWGRTSPEFVAALFGLAALPWPLRKAHRRLRSAAGEAARTA